MEPEFGQCLEFLNSVSTNLSQLSLRIDKAVGEQQSKYELSGRHDCTETWQHSTCQELYGFIIFLGLLWRGGTKSKSIHVNIYMEQKLHTT